MTGTTPHGENCGLDYWFYASRILAKRDLRDRPQAVILAIRAGITGSTRGPHDGCVAAVIIVAS